MSSWLHALLALAALAFGALLPGCVSQDVGENGTVPQARPADWQGGIPGLGGLHSGATGTDAVIDAADAVIDAGLGSAFDGDTGGGKALQYPGGPGNGLR